MKCSITWAMVGLVSVLNIQFVLASKSNKIKIDKVHSEVLAYVYQHMGELRMMRGNSANLRCYTKFLPLVNSLAATARDISEVCVSNANFKKENELKRLRNHRSDVAAEVAKVTKYFEDCSKVKGLGYFNCLVEITDYNIRLMESINIKSRDIVAKYGAIFAEIDRVEQTCLNDAVDSAKSKTDKAFDDLKLCLVNRTNWM